MEIASKANNYHYNKALQPLANANRRNMTKSAAALWKYVLRNRQMRGYTFRRERPILDYIADFVCLDLLLVIEVDGVTHELAGRPYQDAQRDEVLAEVGFTTLRFSSWEVLNRITDVAERIGLWIDMHVATPPKKP